jgi:hypothetical protein
MAGPVRLAPDGVWRAAASPRRWWALTPPFHPYRRHLRRHPGGGLLSVPLSVGFRRLACASVLPYGVRTFLDRPSCDGRPRSPGLRRNRSACHERALVGELAAALGTENTAARVHDELTTGEALERRAAQQSGQLLVERPMQGRDVHRYSSRKTPTTRPMTCTYGA